MAVSRVGVVESAAGSVAKIGVATDRDEWGERAGRLYEELRRPAARMVRRAFGRAFSDDEIEDLYGSAWVGTLRALAPGFFVSRDLSARKRLG